MKNIVIILVLFLFFSCNNKQEITQQNEISDFKEAKGYVVPKDSMVEPRAIPINENKLKKIPLGNPKIIAANSNTRSAGSPKIIFAGTPKIITPGTDTFSLPIIVSAIDSPFVIKTPKPKDALALRKKDNAVCNIQYLDVEQGLNSSYVWQIIEDKSGNLWITSQMGLCKYDGKSFTDYNIFEKFNIATISIFQDRNDNIWFGTSNNGVYKFDGKSFTNYSTEEGLSGDDVSSILQDKKGNLWFGTLDGGVSKYNGKYFTHYTQKQGLSNNCVKAVLEDKNGNLWFATKGGGVSKFDGKSFVNYTEKEGLGTNKIQSIMEDRYGNLWFGTIGNGMVKFDGKKFSQYTDKEGLNNNIVMSIFEDRNNNIWFGTLGGGLNKFDGTTFTYYTNKEGLSSNYIRSIFEDNSGNILLGTLGGGLCKFSENSFSHFDDKDALVTKKILSILEDKHGNIWLGMDGNGLAKFDGKKFSLFPNIKYLNTVYSILEDKNGNLWFGSINGDLIKFDGKYFVNYKSELGLSGYSIVSSFEDMNGNLWFGTAGDGVVKYDGHFFTQFTQKQGLSGNTITAILEDKNRNLWFSTYGNGVTKYDGKRFYNFSEKDGLSNNLVWDILEDRYGNLWFGTDYGVNKFDGNRFTHFTDKEGLCGNIVQSMIEDNNGNFWVGTTTGLNCFVFSTQASGNFKIGNGNVDPKIITFHMDDGLKAEDFYYRSVFLDSKNRIWWGTGKALTVLNLDNFSIERDAPTIQLNNVYIDENFDDYNGLKEKNINEAELDKSKIFKKIEFINVDRFHNYPVGLKLPYYLNHITFQFSAIDWSAPHKIKYQYKLEGLENDWCNLTADNKADYRNIPHGTYTFKVKALGNLDKWSNTFEYSFIIHPPWWLTWWAYSSYGLMAITLVVVIVKWNSKKLRARANELKLRVEEATQEILVQKELVVEQKLLIEERHKEITDSINYAERIQRSLLASKQLLDENLNDYFILFKPKDVVSGDFYWAAKLRNGHFALMCADSTGHGVPGAIMSILNISCLEKSVEVEKLITPDEILIHTRAKIIEILKKDGSLEGGKDGMDGCLLSFDLKNYKLYCSLANNPVWIIRKQEIIEIKPDRFPIGKHEKDNQPFTLHTFNLQKGDVVYTFTDGFPDQFGGTLGKKFMIKNLRELLIKITHLPMSEQEALLEKTFNDWVGNLEQVDDVSIIGIRV